jgi:hypothetical protein
MLRERFERAKTEGDLPADADAAALARYIQTVFSGLCIEAAAGASSAELKEAAARALAGWPSRGA